MVEGHFFIIGAQRCGTTYLYQILDEHPEIQMAKPVRPEPKFFIDQSNGDRSAYLTRYFTPQASTRLLGEKSTSYIEFPEVATRIRRSLPESKILVILRNPVDRAISNYYFTKKHGLETRTLEEVFLEHRPEPKIDRSRYSVSPFAYVERGQYHKFLVPWFERFGSSRIRVIIFEQFIGQAEKISQLYAWLGVASEYLPSSLQEKVNPGERRSQELHEVTRSLANKYIFHNQCLSHFLNTDLSFWNKYL